MPDPERHPQALAGPAKGDFVPPPPMADVDESPQALPSQEEFFRPPVRFGSVPVEKEPLGWDRRKAFRKHFPVVSLPTQVVDRVTFGHPELEPNRLFCGDNLHVMRQLPSESIDLIYIAPPFFSGRQYNVIFGDQNELRSFSDIWEGGMPGYLIWLNARLYEMKRLLKKTGSIYVHLDWHASHYVRVEMDKVFGYDAFKNEIIWEYGAGGTSPYHWARKHDAILYYSRSDKWIFNVDSVREPYDSPEKVEHKIIGEKAYLRKHPLGRVPRDVWYIPTLTNTAKERIGYPTQKTEALLDKIIVASSNEGEVVADFFCGGGTTPAVAQRLGRRWIACDQSRVAVALTADRLARGAEQLRLEGVAHPIPDFTVEHWGVYETKRLTETPPDQFREFVLRAFGAVPESPSPSGRGVGGEGAVPSPFGRGQGEGIIHGHKGAVPVWVGEPDQRSPVTPKQVQAFANAIRKTIRYQQDNLRDGIMLAWAFRPDAVEAADRLRALEQTDLNFIRLDMIRIDSPTFREHISSLSTDHADYATFLTFVQPPKVEVGWKKLGGRNYVFDVSETAVLNSGAKIINVQWDFDYQGRFSSTPGYQFLRGKNKEPQLQVQYEFPRTGSFDIACKVQDDMGGEGLWTGEIKVQ